MERAVGAVLTGMKGMTGMGKASNLEPQARLKRAPETRNSSTANSRNSEPGISYYGVYEYAAHFFVKGRPLGG
jgi:hypothetical protein